MFLELASFVLSLFSEEVFFDQLVWHGVAFSCHYLVHIKHEEVSRWERLLGEGRFVPSFDLFEIEDRLPLRVGLVAQGHVLRRLLGGLYPLLLSVGLGEFGLDQGLGDFLFVLLGFGGVEFVLEIEVFVGLFDLL